MDAAEQLVQKCLRDAEAAGLNALQAELWLVCNCLSSTIHSLELMRAVLRRHLDTEKLVRMQTTKGNDAPLPREYGRWLAFEAGTPRDEARARFAERYGRQPASVVKAGAVLLAGPLTEEAEEAPSAARKW